MITRTIIASRLPVVVPHTSEYRFVARTHKVSRITPPSHYSVTRRLDGSVMLTEYASPEEWSDHRARIARTLAKYHSQMGVQSKCHCDYCSTANVA